VKMRIQKQGDAFYPFDAEAVEDMVMVKDDGVFLVSIKSLSKRDQRSIDQNRMQFKWYADAAKQGDHTAMEYRAYCKLHFGVKLLRAHDEEFREIYDKIIRPLQYEDKLAMMMEPIDLPITSRMSVELMAKYLKEVSDHFLALGFQLTKFEHFADWLKQDIKKH